MCVECLVKVFVCNIAESGFGDRGAKFCWEWPLQCDEKFVGPHVDMSSVYIVLLHESNGPLVSVRNVQRLRDAIRRSYPGGRT